MTENEDERLTNLRETLILEAMSDGRIWYPSDFDEGFTGEPALHAMLNEIVTGAPPQFNREYGEALTRLIESGHVKFWRDADGNACYQLISVKS